MVGHNQQQQHHKNAIRFRVAEEEHKILNGKSFVLFIMLLLGPPPDRVADEAPPNRIS